jgi:hypothetical protein
MIWLGYVYLVILILFGGSALLDDIKAKKMGRFAISLVPFAVLVIVTVGFLFLPKPSGWAWLIVAALAVSVLILVWDGIQDVKDLSRTDPEFGTGGAIFSSLLVALVFTPAVILGVLWAR